MTLPVPAAVNSGLALPARFPSPSNFPAYARMAHQVPMLEADRERDLVAAWRETGDAHAARELVLAHLRLVVKVVRAHRGYGLPEADLAQEGTVGLMRAVHGFDPAVGVRLAAYAVRWIEAEIREFIFRNFRLVRLGGTAAMKKLFFGYRATMQTLARMGAERSAEVSPAQVAQALGVPEDQARQAQAYFTGTDLALDAPAGEDAAPSHALMLQALPCDQQTPAVVAEQASTTTAIAACVREALEKLPARDREIVAARRLASPPVGLVELGKQWGISAERVRQLEQRAWERLRTELETMGARSLVA